MDKILNPFKPVATSRPDVLHDQQLLRDLAIANARTVHALGPSPVDGLHVATKRQPNFPSRATQAPVLVNEQEEDRTMKFSQVGVAVLMTAGAFACNQTTSADANDKAAASVLVTEAKEVAAPPTSNATSVWPQVEEPSRKEQTSTTSTVPDKIGALVGPDDTLLAYKTMDLTGDGEEDAAIVIRHAATNPYDNSCELLILKFKSGMYQISGRNNKIVDCVNNIYAREIATNSGDLNEYISIGKFEITYNNVKAVGHTSYSFKFSEEKQIWYLYKVSAVYKQNNEENGGVDLVEEIAIYPDDFKFIDMNSFDPMNTLNDIKWHRKVN